MKKISGQTFYNFDTDELGEKIRKTYKHFNVNVSIDIDLCQDQIRYIIKPKGNTRKADIFTYSNDVQTRLKLPIFQICEEQFTIYLIVSSQEVKYPRILEILKNHTNKKAMEKMELPYVVGHDVFGQPVIVDVAIFPHLLLGGSTNSGKSISLRAFITTLIKTKSPSEVNLILMDVGAGDLIAFNEIPHLSCPIVRDHDTAYRTVIALKAEMERRIKMEHTDPSEFKQLPRLVLVIDEFPALFSGELDKNTSKELISAFSGFLQRGRHAKIHLVLAAQNPTYLNMKIDMSNITARIAFRCAKRNFSETILGESGAENLRGPGSLFLKSPQGDSLQWIQGIYIKDRDIQKVTRPLKYPYYVCNKGQKFHLIIPTDSPAGNPGDLSSKLSTVKVAAGPSEQDLTLASVIFWAFGQKHISTNMLMQSHHFGWNRATNYVKQLEELGIVDKLDGKRARSVRPKCIEELPAELLEFMERCDYPSDSLIFAFQERAEANTADKQRSNSGFSGGVPNEQTD
ncbi:MAG: hypothetical protein K2O18_15765 [Oscillospiraceae bacterium]|nr:hypothetical protein [Oscillospiraceae bacterium]